MGNTLIPCCGGRANKLNGSNNKDNIVDKHNLNSQDPGHNYHSEPTKSENNDKKLKKYSTFLNKNINKKYTHDNEKNIDEKIILENKEFHKIKTLPLKIFHENEEITVEKNLNYKINKEINKRYRMKSRDFNDSNIK